MRPRRPPPADPNETREASSEPKLRMPDVTDKPLTADSGLPRTPVAPAARSAPAPADERRRPAPGRPANDDKRAVGEILQTLQARPRASRRSIAFLGSLVWLGVFGAYSLGALGRRPDLAANPLAQLLMRPEAALLIFGAIIPVIVMFVLAALFSRAQEMRNVARSMTQVAIRLAEPEGLGTESMVSLSQAIRREVAAMGDGIERAVARAGELETLVHSEIATLERAYGENEIRIRALIDELVAQREAILSNADRVRTSITASHESLRDDLHAASAQISAGGRRRRRARDAHARRQGRGDHRRAVAHRRRHDQRAERPRRRPDRPPHLHQRGRQYPPLVGQPVRHRDARRQGRGDHRRSSPPRARS